MSLLLACRWRLPRHRPNRLNNIIFRAGLCVMLILTFIKKVGFLMIIDNNKDTYCSRWILRFRYHDIMRPNTCNHYFHFMVNRSWLSSNSLRRFTDDVFQIAQTRFVAVASDLVISGVGEKSRNVSWWLIDKGWWPRLPLGCTLLVFMTIQVGANVRKGILTSDIKLKIQL